MEQFDSDSYGSVFASLLNVDRRRPLGAGKSIAGSQPALRSLAADTAFAHAKIVDRDMAACCVAGLWLLYDDLDASHAISQGIPISSGSFWHAIMHRREGDFSNAKYWFRQVGEHGVFERLAARADELAAELGDTTAIARLTTDNRWDPLAFVEMCAAAQRGNHHDHALCVEIQQAEWELLFDFCYHAAVGQ